MFLMRISLFIMLLFVVAASALQVDAKIPTQVKKSVAYIFVKDSNNRLEPSGTGFFVMLKAIQNADTANFGYLVTVKNSFRRRDKLSLIDTVYIRLNRKDGYSDTLNIPLVINGAPRYFLHPDSTVDLIAVPAYPDLKRYDFLFTPAGIIAQMDFIQRENITEGEEVFHAGMEQAHIGRYKNIPVVRMGSIAQLSEEKYATSNGLTEFYMIETTFSKHSAGSPVFYYVPAKKDTGTANVPAKFFLTGVLVGHYGQPLDNLVAVIPAFKLSELLNTQEVIRERESEFIRLRNAKGQQ